MPNEMTPIDCRTAVQQLWDFLDEELTAERMDVMHKHLRECSHCLPHTEFAERFLAALQATRDDRPCPSVVRQKVMESLRTAGMTVS